MASHASAPNGGKAKHLGLPNLAKLLATDLGEDDEEEDELDEADEDVWAKWMEGPTASAKKKKGKSHAASGLMPNGVSHGSGDGEGEETRSPA